MTPDDKERPQEAGESGRSVGAKEPHAHDDACRCKETSTLSPRELLRLMMDDLAFWKKPKGG